MLIWVALVQLFSFFSNPTADPVNWRERRQLNWTDFKAAPIETAPNAALTSTSILIGYRYNDHSLDFELNCVFYPHRSWTKVNTKHILNHEQGHFDICQLYTRKLYKELKAYNFKSATAEADIKKVYQRISQEQAAFQQLYDKETNYSRNVEGQTIWIKKIEDELDRLKEYANYPQKKN